MTYPKFIFLAIISATFLAHVIAVYRFNNFADDLIQKVENSRAPQPALQNIPDIILNFVHRAGVDDKALAGTVTLTQKADMRLEKGGDWQALTAKQVISTGEMGFVWLAEQKMGFLTKFRVIDAYVQGEGQLRVRLLGSIPLVNHTGRDADIAEVMRYLSELVWAPDAMIGDLGLNWKVVTERSVYISVTLPVDGNGDGDGGGGDGGIEVGVTYIFDDEGDIVEVHADNRPAEIVDGKAVLRDWRIKVGGYKDFNDRRVPSKGEVGYIYEDGYEAYWRGEVLTYFTR